MASLEARLAAESAPKAEVLEKTRPPHAEGVKEQEGSEPDNRGAASMERGPMAGSSKKSAAKEQGGLTWRHGLQRLLRKQRACGDAGPRDAAAQEAGEKLEEMTKRENDLRAQLAAAAEGRAAQTGAVSDEAQRALEATTDRGVDAREGAPAAASGSETSLAHDSSAQASPDALRMELETGHAKQRQAAEEAAVQLQGSLDAALRDRDAAKVQLAAASSQLQALQAQRAEAASSAGSKKAAGVSQKSQRGAGGAGGRKRCARRAAYAARGSAGGKGAGGAARRDASEHAAELGARLEAAEAAREAAEKQAAALHEQAQGLRTAAQPVQATQSTRRRSTIDQSARPRPAAAGGAWAGAACRGA